jgi:uncharacterized protein
LKTILIIFAFSINALISTANAADFKVPTLSGPVVDNARVINAQTRAELENFIRNLNARGIAQLQVLTVPSLDGETIEGASIKIVDKWKLGDAKKDNGVLLLVTIAERQLRIEVGQGLEGDLTDLYSRRIIDNVIVPQFRADNFSEGIRLGIFEIARKIDPQFAENNNTPKMNLNYANSMQPKNLGLRNIIEVIFFIIMAIIFIASRGRRSRHWLGGGMSGLGGGGFSGGGSSWGGGGGGFSGGGSSGRW